MTRPPALADLFVPIAPYSEFRVMHTTIDYDALVAKVNKLGASKDAADAATADSTAAHAALQQAQVDAVAADAVEARADDQVAADWADLKAFVDGVAPSPEPPPAPVPG